MSLLGNKASESGEPSSEMPPQFTLRNADTLPAPYERHFDDKGFAYYKNHDDKTTSRLNPVTAKELQQEGKKDRELIMAEKMKDGEVYFVHYGRELPMGKIVGAPSSQNRE
ncbi:hypothetical protein MMC13_001962 [Lambiella insularis]|nr:hypothetical protein [Lambiella insularis]